MCAEVDVRGGCKKSLASREQGFFISLRLGVEQDYSVRGELGRDYGSEIILHKK